jgi:hypothetical protein
MIHEACDCASERLHHVSRSPGMLQADTFHSQGSTVPLVNERTLRIYAETTGGARLAVVHCN